MLHGPLVTGTRLPGRSGRTTISSYGRRPVSRRHQAFPVLALLLLLACASCGNASSKAPTPANGRLSSTRAALDGGQSPNLASALPGAERPGPDLLRRLETTWTSRDPAYVPRTRHLNPDGTPMYANRLFLQSSPYLRQHAHNPVNWYPWGDEAFETARRLHRPVLLSVGYSTCHWCHVMEEESFEDEAIARYMNENYVAIKVDREERPDVDEVYMSAVQMMTGSGGWPMTVWLTPDRKPFYGGTYFPPRDGDRGAGVGFMTILGRLRRAYDDQPDKIAQAAAKVAQGIQQALTGSVAADSVPGASVLEAAFHDYEGQFDAVNGGLNRSPKFPSSLPIRFLLRYHHRAGQPKALAMARLTLRKMAAGGMYDQVGGGFHRYSTDGHWLVPHFEKMLYDNALLTMAYLDGWQVTSDSSFTRVARDILRYVQRDMTSPEGAFYSATDADSQGPDGRREEGWYFTWTPAEIRAALGERRARIVERYFGVTAAGNFEGRNILSVTQPDEQTAREFRMSPAALRSVVDAAREVLYQARAGRRPPLRDEKIITAWNGLMISAHARAALILGQQDYAQRAERAADFVLTHMRKEGVLFRSFKDGQARQPGYLDDYAFLIAGLLDLYEATGRARWLEEAIALDRVLEGSFADAQHGGFFMTGSGHEALLAREKPGDDGAEPSGNSVEALNLLRLAEFTGDDHYLARADHTLEAFAGVLTSSPTALSEMLLALDFRLDFPKEIVIVTRGARQDAEPLLARLRSSFVPNRTIVIAREGPDLEQQAKLVPLLKGKVAQGGRPTAYVCERGVCDLPTRDPDVFARQLARVRPLPRPKLAGAATRRGK